MTNALPKSAYTNLDNLAEDLFKKLDGHIVMGIPIGIGKATQLVNALYKLAKQNPQYQLDIHTALSLTRPILKTDLERRLLKPFFDRHFKNVPDLQYMVDAKQNNLPANVNLIEFYFKPGEMLKSPKAQQQVLSANYTHVARDMVDREVNLVTQMISKRQHHEQTEYSLSSNPDVTLDLQRLMRQKSERDGRTRILVAQVNPELPFMGRDAKITADFFDYIYDEPSLYTPLFCTPHQPISPIDHMIGFYTSAMVKDAGTLQIGIGSLGDAVVNALLMRQNKNKEYRKVLNDLAAFDKFPIIEKDGGYDTFTTGLYGNTEMLVPGYMELKNGGVLKRKVYDDLTIQRLVNSGLDPENLNIDWLFALANEGKIQTQLTEHNVDYLRRWGLLKETTYWEDQQLCAANFRCEANLNNPESCKQIAQWALGDKIADATLIHAGFFVGTGHFYEQLHQLTDHERNEINMTSVAITNQLLGNESLKLAQRHHARFINACMKTTLSGASVSDGLSDGKVVSGVGGQFNFVAMAHDIPDARSILMMRSWRQKGNTIISNVVFNYGHTTIPRHMRDIIITEYGIANLRGKNDHEIIEELLKITDSRFQKQLIKKAKKAGKLSTNYQLPHSAKNNFPETIKELVEKNSADLFVAFPFGKELTDQEVILGGALKRIKNRLTALWPLIPALIQKQSQQKITANHSNLERMSLRTPSSIKERIFRKLLLAELPDAPTHSSPNRNEKQT